MANDFKPGDRVRITDGTFEGFEGVVLERENEEVVPAKGLYPLSANPFTALWVSINTFGRETKLKISADLLELA